MQIKPNIIPATLEDYPLIENLWRFYVYDMGRYCGFNKGWECPTQLSFVPDDLTHYFIDQDRKAFLVKVDGECAGFVLLYKGSAVSGVDWKISEFFIISKFQGQGMGEQVAGQIFNKFTGIWGLTVTPENKRALDFWRKVISKYTGGNFSEEIKTVDYNTLNPKRVFFRFNSEKNERTDINPVKRRS